MKVLDSHGVGDDHTVALAIEQLPRDGADRQPLASAATRRTTPRRWPWRPRCKIVRGRGGAIVAAAGNSGPKRPFWPAAFKAVLAVGAVEFGKRWARAPWSNYGYWVDAAARGVNTASTYATDKTRYCETEGGPVTEAQLQGLGPLGRDDRSPRRSSPAASPG